MKKSRAIRRNMLRIIPEWMKCFARSVVRVVKLSSCRVARVAGVAVAKCANFARTLNSGLKSHHKALVAAALAVGLVVAPVSVDMAVGGWQLAAVSAAPEGGIVVGGDATINAAGNVTTVSQTSDRVAIDWSSFDISKNETVTFAQPGVNSAALNRVIGNTASQIFGHIKANGQIYIVNPNGLNVGSSAVINVGGLTLSTSDISPAAFLSPIPQSPIPNPNASAIIVNGTITAADSGRIIIIADKDSGTLDMTNAVLVTRGGFVETSAAHVTGLDSVHVDTCGGTWLIDPTDFNIGGTSSDMSGEALANNLNSNSITILSSQGKAGSNGDINVNYAVSWNADTNLTLSAYSNVNVNAVISNANSTAAKVNLIADNTGIGYTSVLPNSGGSVIFSGGSIALNPTGTAVNIYYNPTSFANPMSFASNVVAGTTTAYMLVNQLGGSADGVNVHSLAALSNNVSLLAAGQAYALGRDIDASGTANWKFKPLSNSANSFDGQGHTLSNLKINSGNAGLFAGNLNSLLQVSNLTMDKATISGTGNAGAVVGAGAAQLNNIVVLNSNIASSGSAAGGIAGDITPNSSSALHSSVSNSSITNSNINMTNNASVSNIYAGGAVGRADGYTSSLVNIQANNVKVSSNGGYNAFVGGIVGGYWGVGSTINNVGVYGATINTVGQYYINVGGVVGSDYSNLSYATVSGGSITATGQNCNVAVGGIAGVNCYTADNVIVDELSITACNSDGAAIAGGVAGVNYYKISNAVVRNIAVQAKSISDSVYAGGIAGSSLWIDGGTLSNVKVTANSNTGWVYAGGVAGSTGFKTVNVSGSNINVNASSTGTAGHIMDFVYAGGLVGYTNYQGSAKLQNDVLSNVTVSASSTYANVEAGGLVGENSTPLTYCAISNATINVSGANSPTLFAGGAAGFSGYITQNTTISNVTVNAAGGSYATYVGGAVGYNDGGTGAATDSNNVISDAKVSADGGGDVFAGGFAGINTQDISTLPINTVNINAHSKNGSVYAGGLIGQHSSSCNTSTNIVGVNINGASVQAVSDTGSVYLGGELGQNLDGVISGSVWDNISLSGQATQGVLHFADNVADNSSNEAIGSNVIGIAKNGTVAFSKTNGTSGSWNVNGSDITLANNNYCTDDLILGNVNATNSLNVAAVGNLDIADGCTLKANGAGSAIILSTGGLFTTNIGNANIGTPNGRYLIYMINPSSNKAPNLTALVDSATYPNSYSGNAGQNVFLYRSTATGKLVVSGSINVADGATVDVMSNGTIIGTATVAGGTYLVNLSVSSLSAPFMVCIDNNASTKGGCVYSDYVPGVSYNISSGLLTANANSLSALRTALGGYGNYGASNSYMPYYVTGNNVQFRPGVAFTVNSQKFVLDGNVSTNCAAQTYNTQVTASQPITFTSLYTSRDAVTFNGSYTNTSGATNINANYGNIIFNGSANMSGQAVSMNAWNITAANPNNQFGSLAISASQAVKVNAAGALALNAIKVGYVATINASGDVTINGANVIGRTLTIAAGGNLTISSGSTISAGDTGNALVLSTGGNFITSITNSAISTPAGRFLVYMVNPVNNKAPNLTALTDTATYPANYTANSGQSVFLYQSLSGVTNLVLAGNANVTDGSTVDVLSNGVLLGSATVTGGKYTVNLSVNSLTAPFMVFIDQNASVKGGSLFNSYATGNSYDLTGSMLTENNLSGMSAMRSLLGSYSNSYLPYSYSGNNINLASGVGFTANGSTFNVDGAITTTNASQIYNAAINAIAAANFNALSGGNINFNSSYSNTTAATNINAAGAIIMTGAVNTGSQPLVFNANGAVTATNSANAIGNVSVITAASVNLNDSSALMLGAINTGSLTINSSNAISQSAAAKVSGATTITGTDVALNSAANDFTTITAQAKGNLIVVDANALTIAGANSAGGTYTAVANGDLTISSGSTLNANATGNALTLSTSGNFVTPLANSAITTANGRFLVYMVNPTSNKAPNLTAASDTAAYPAAYTGNAGQNVFLYQTMPTSNLIVAGSANVVDGSTVDVISNGVLLGSATVTGGKYTVNLSVNSLSTPFMVFIDQNASVKGGSLFSSYTTGSSYDLTSSMLTENNLSGMSAMRSLLGSYSNSYLPYSYSGNNINLASGVGFTANGGTFNIDGNITTTNASQIYNAAINAIAAANFNALTAGNINFNGSYTNTTGATNINAVGAIAMTGAVNTGNQPLVFNSGAAVTANNSANIIGNVSVITAASVSLSDSSAVTLGAVNTGAFAINSKSSISQSGAAKVSGTATITGSDITLDNTANDFNTITLTAKGNAKIVDANALTLAGANSADGTYTAVANGDLTINSGSTINANATGNALTLSTAGNFITPITNSAITTANGRFLVYMVNPANNKATSLTAAADTATYPATYSSNAGQNVFLYQPTPSGNLVVGGNANVADGSMVDVISNGVLLGSAKVTGGKYTVNLSVSSISAPFMVFIDQNASVKGGSLFSSYTTGSSYDLTSSMLTENNLSGMSAMRSLLGSYSNSYLPYSYSGNNISVSSGLGFTVNGGTFTVDGAITTTNASQIYNAALNAIAAANFSALTAGNLTFNGAVNANGNAVTVSAQAITATNSANDFANVQILKGTTVKLTDSTAIAVGSSSAVTTLTINAAGDATLGIGAQGLSTSGDITATAANISTSDPGAVFSFNNAYYTSTAANGTIAITAPSHSVRSVYSNAFSGTGAHNLYMVNSIGMGVTPNFTLTSLAGSLNNVSYTDSWSSPITLGGKNLTNISGNLIVNCSGNLLQSAAISVGGNAKFSSGFNNYQLAGYDNYVAGNTTFVRNPSYVATVNYRNLANAAGTTLTLPTNIQYLSIYAPGSDISINSDTNIDNTCALTARTLTLNSKLILAQSFGLMSANLTLTGSGDNFIVNKGGKIVDYDGLANWSKTPAYAAHAKDALVINLGATGSMKNLQGVDAISFANLNIDPLLKPRFIIYAGAQNDLTFGGLLGMTIYNKTAADISTYIALNDSLNYFLVGNAVPKK